VLRVDVASGAVVRMTRTTDSISDVRPSPDGRAITFVRAHDLWAAIVQDGKARTLRLTHGGSELQRNGDLDWLYPEELDAKTAAWWSPDATRVAYLALDETQVPRFPLVAYEETGGSVEGLQYPKAGEPNPVPSVHVVGLDGAAPVALDLGPDRDVYVPWATWWPDGSKVAVAILDRAQTRFELRLCDPAGGPGTTFLVETDAHWVDVPLPPRFLASRKAFVWTSRRDGFWRHWLVPLDGGEPRALTPAGVDVEAVPSRRRGRGHDLVERALAGPLARRDLEGRSTAAIPWRSPTTCARTTCWGARRHASSSTRRRASSSPARRSCAAPTGPRSAGWRPRRRRPTPRSPSKRPSWSASPDPRGRRASTSRRCSAAVTSTRRPRPVVVHTYGGPGARLTKDAFGGGHLLEHLLAREGTWCSSSTDVGPAGAARPSGGRPPPARRVEVADQARAVRWLAQRPGVDGTRVGIWGWSYGGFMACAALVRAPDVFDAAVAVASVTDWRHYDTIYTERYMDRPQENADGYKTTAPARRAAEVRGALLLCHGLADDNVHAQNTIHMAEAMLQAGKRCEVALYAHRAHGIEGEKAHRDLFGRLVAHFKQHLFDAPTGGKNGGSRRPRSGTAGQEQPAPGGGARGRGGVARERRTEARGRGRARERLLGQAPEDPGGQYFGSFHLPYWGCVRNALCASRTRPGCSRPPGGRDQRGVELTQNSPVAASDTGHALPSTRGPAAMKARKRQHARPRGGRPSPSRNAEHHQRETGWTWAHRPPGSRRTHPRTRLGRGAGRTQRIDGSSRVWHDTCKTSMGGSDRLQRTETWLPWRPCPCSSRPRARWTHAPHRGADRDRSSARIAAVRSGRAHGRRVVPEPGSSTRVRPAQGTSQRRADRSRPDPGYEQRPHARPGCQAPRPRRDRRSRP
jgi:dipeptidyl-peptidase-4